MAEPIKLSAVAGTSMSNSEVADWLRLWADHIEEDMTAQVRTIAIVAEDTEGQIGVVNTGRPSDKARLLGILHFAADRVLCCDNNEKGGFLTESIDS